MTEKPWFKETEMMFKLVQQDGERKFQKKSPLPK